jgi:PII-like signaling protein
VLTAPLEPGSFELVSSIGCLHHMDSRAGLTRLRDLVATGGVLAIVGMARADWPKDAPLAALTYVAARVRPGARRNGDTPRVPVVWPPPERFPAMRDLAAEVLPGVWWCRRLLVDPLTLGLTSRIDYAWRQPDDALVRRRAPSELPRSRLMASAEPDRSVPVDQDCIKLTSYGQGQRHAGSRLPGGTLDGGGDLAASIVLHGTEGAVVHQRLSTGPSPVVTGAGQGLVTMQRARLLREQIDPVGLWDEDGQATRLTVYLSREDRVFQVPAFEVICELLYRRGCAGATVLPGTDAVRERRHQFFGSAGGTPVMVIAIGSADELGPVLPELGGLLRHPVMTVERVRVCKRDGQLIAPLPAIAGNDAEGRPLHRKLTVYSSETARHDGRPVHREVIRRLSSMGMRGTTVRGMWGFGGDHLPRGGHYVPAVTT